MIKVWDRPLEEYLPAIPLFLHFSVHSEIHDQLYGWAFPWGLPQSKNRNTIPTEHSHPGNHVSRLKGRWCKSRGGRGFRGSDVGTVIISDSSILG